jgi:hypothetical protein
MGCSSDGKPKVLNLYNEFEPRSGKEDIVIHDIVGNLPLNAAIVIHPDVYELYIEGGRYDLVAEISFFAKCDASKDEELTYSNMAALFKKAYKLGADALLLRGKYKGPGTTFDSSAGSSAPTSFRNPQTGEYETIPDGGKSSLPMPRVTDPGWYLMAYCVRYQL